MEYRGLQLDRFQREAIEALARGESVLVCAPTGTGKTMVADWIVEKALEDNKQVVYTAPIKALSNQKFRDYCSLLGEDKTGLVTGDLVIRRDAPCRVMTTEILRNMLLTGEQLDDLAAVIIDEIHFLDDKERGTTWEEVLIYLPPHVQIVGLSATLANLQEFAEWLRMVRQGPVTVVEEYTRAVPLTFQVATREGGLRSPRKMKQLYADWQQKNKSRSRRNERRHKGGSRRPRRLAENTSHIDIFQMIDREDLYPYLYFVFSRRQTEQLARSLCEAVARRYRTLLSYEESEEMERQLARFCEDENNRAALTDGLADMYRLGVAFHHAGLNVLLKGFVESLYEQKLIKALYCTGTFALGINMPARTACFDGLQRYDGRGMIPLPTREFMQMAGRAGRRGMDEEGIVIIRTSLDDYGEIAPQLGGYLASDYEPVRSNFSLSFNSVVNLIDRLPPERIRELVEKSFLSFFRERRAEQQLAKAEGIEEDLREAGWDGEGTADRPAMRRQVKQLNKLKRRADSGKERTWAEFEEKVQFLVDVGYLEADGLAFNLGAKVLRNLQIQEVFATEMVIAGMFEGMEPTLMFGVLCGMVSELPRGVSVPASRHHKRIGREIARIRESDVVVTAEQLTGLQVSWDHQLIPIGKWWAEGRPLSEITYNIITPTDISGSLVGAFRRAKDLAGQLRDVWREDRDRVEMLSDLIRSVSRDEVEVVG